jgi:hypothetical protein
MFNSTRSFMYGNTVFWGRTVGFGYMGGGKNLRLCVETRQAIKLPSQTRERKCLFAALLGEQDGVNVGENTTGSDGNSSEELVELFIVLDGKSDVARYDTALLVVTGGVSGELEDLSTEVLEDSGEVDRGASSHTGGVLALTEVTADTTDGELKTSLGRSSGRLLLSAATLSFSFSRHVDVSLVFG